MAIIYDFDAANYANGTNLTAATPTVGTVLVKHANYANDLTVQSGEVECTGGTAFYVTQESVADGNVEVDAVVRVYTDNASYLAMFPQIQQNADSWSGSLAPFSNDASIILAASTILTQETTWPAESALKMRCETYGGITRLFLNNCEVVRGYEASPITNKRAGFGYQGGTSADTGFRFKTVRVATDFDTNQVVCIGDSLTRGIDGSSAFLPFRDNYPYLLAQELDGIHVSNMGRGGDTVANMVTRSNATSSATDTVRWGYRQSYRPSAEKNIAVMWAGVNDLIASRTPAQILADVEAHAATLQGEGWQFIAVGHLHSGSNLVPAGYNDDIDTLIGLLNASTVFDGVVDLSTDARLADPEDTTYFDADKLHLKAAGNAVVAELVAAGVNALLSSGSPSYIGSGYGGHYLGG